METGKTRNRDAAFTLIELLIVVSIIAILAAIAVPNFLEAQTRAKTSRVKADMRSIATALASFNVDHNNYPRGTDDRGRVPAHIEEYFSHADMAPGAGGADPYAYYTFQTVDIPDSVSGHALTTPIAYMTSIPTDPFVITRQGIFYSYREGRDGDRTGYIITSFGPDLDGLQNGGKENACGTLTAEACGRHGDLSEVHALPGSGRFEADNNTRRRLLHENTYDPSNGTISDGDLWRAEPL